MGTVNDAIFANKLGHFYEDLAQQLGGFLHTHIGQLSKDQVDTLSDSETQLNSYANAFFTLSDTIAFQQSDVYFKGVSDTIDAVNADIQKIADINKIITISAGVISLALAIFSENGGGILSSLQTIAGAVK